MNNIDEKAIWEWLGYECLEEPDDPDERFRLIVYKDGKRIAKPNIYSLDWQAKSLDTKLGCFTIVRYGDEDYGMWRGDGFQANPDYRTKDEATVKLLAVMELIRGKK